VTLAQELARTPRVGATVYGFVAAVYPSDHPALPDEGGSSDGGNLG
jgi:hypothetical protein